MYRNKKVKYDQDLFQEPTRKVFALLVPIKVTSKLLPDYGHAMRSHGYIQSIDGSRKCFWIDPYSHEHLFSPI